MLKFRYGSFLGLLTLTVVGAESLTPWARIDPENGAGIQFLNKRDYAENYFEKGGPAKSDDWGSLYFSGVNLPASAAKIENGNAKFSGPVTVGKEKRPFFCNGTVEVLSPRKLIYSLNLKADSEQELGETFLSVPLYKSFLGRPIRFEYDDNTAYTATIQPELNAGYIWSSPENKKVRAISVPMMHGTLKITVPNRSAMLSKWGKDVGNIRIYFDSGNLKELNVSATMEFIPYKTFKLDLTKAVNMGFADETADDKKGGWTDQGANNDMRAFKPGKNLHFGNVVFDVIDPAENDGKSVIAMSGPDREYLKKTAEIEMNGECFDYLNLLHSAAYCLGKTAGTVEILYKDGQSQIFEVRNRRDVANWWGGTESFSNATLVWRAQNQASMIGLFLSRFRVENKPVAKVSFRSSGGMVWLIVAASGTVGEMPFPVGTELETPIIIKEGPHWKAFRYSYDRVPGSAYDLSGTLDAPAGKYGRVVIRDGHFQFEKRPGENVRFHGISINNDMALLSDKKLADKLINRSAHLGYNMVRFHRFDEKIMKKGVSDKPEFNPEELDRFFYLFAKAKEHGMYITLDLYGERISGFPRKYNTMHEVRFDLLFDREIRDSMKEFCRLFLTTVNPYTNLALKDDPALISLTLVNEGALIHTNPELFLPNPKPKRQALAGKAYVEWCRKNGLSTEMPDQSKFVRFAVDTHNAFFKEFKEYLSGIGVNVPLSDTNNRNHLTMALVRAPYDFVDNHFYYDHPTFHKGQFSWPQRYHNRSIIKEGFMPLFKEQASTRSFGKPFTITEMNFCGPNQYQCEGGPVMGAVAAIQDWDEIVRLGPYYERKYGWDAGLLGPFSTFMSPLTSLSEPIIHMFWVRGDVKPAPGCDILTIPSDFWKNPLASAFMDWSTRKNSFAPDAVVRRGLVRRIGNRVTVPGEKPAKDEYPIGLFAQNPEPKELQPPADGRYASEDGQVFADIKSGVMKVMTPKSEALVIPQGGMNVSGKALQVADSNTNCTVFAGALDNLPLTESKRILLLHLASVRAREQKQAVSGQALIIYDYGKFQPYLARRAKADITLAAGEGEFTVNALDAAGRTLFRFPLKAVNGKVKIKAAVDAGPEMTAVFGYELIRK